MIQKKIMIVEDEVIFGIDLIEKLENLGYQPDPNIIRYGEGVMDAAQKSKPDLILMDINLKGKMDGIQAAVLVQKHLNIPVIFLTAFSDKETLSNAKKAEPYAFLKKPVKLEDLKITLEIGLYKAKMEKKLKEKIKVAYIEKNKTDNTISLTPSKKIIYLFGDNVPGFNIIHCHVYHTAYLWPFKSS